MNTEYRKVAFLDTDALHFVGLYITHAKCNGLYPFGSRTDDRSAIAEAEQHLGSMPEVKSTKSLHAGLNVLAWISRADIRVEYSPITELELMAGRLRGRALETAAKEGVPDRMWTRFYGNEEEISSRLQLDDLKKVKIRVKELESNLEETGFFVTVSAERAREILDLAKELAGLIYMGVTDYIIYASALSTQAEYLITNDGYFSKVVNKTPDEINRQIRERVGQIIEISSDGVVLPEARKPGKLSMF